MGRFWVFFLSHTAPGFQLWFYFHLCMWVLHWGLLLRLPWRTWVCPCEGQCGGGAAAWVTGVLAAPGTQGGWWLGQQEIQRSRRVWQPVLANILQYSCLENPLLDRKAWQATVYKRVCKECTIQGREDPLEKEMATHSSILAWRIPWTEEPGGLQSTGRKESDND